MLRARQFWEQRSLHPVARLLLVLAVGVLLCIAIGFAVSSGEFTRYDLLAVAFYAGVAAFAWHPMTAAVIVMLISSVGVVFTGSGGDLLELAVALSLVAATCAPWVIVTHAVLLGVLIAYITTSSSALAAGGVYGIVGIAVIAFLGGVAFRLVAAREAFLVAERTRLAKDLEAIARESQERIADELHDGIAHDLTLVLFHARALPRQPDEEARQVSLSTIEQSAENALGSIQSLLSMMRDTATDGPPAYPTRYEGKVVVAATSLGALLKDAGIPTRVKVPHSGLPITPAAERALTEIAIEAVTNILKHAPRTQSAAIEILARTGSVELVVKNVSPSETPAQALSSGRGLHRARQRISESAGVLVAGRATDGWVFRATVPAVAGHVN